MKHILFLTLFGFAACGIYNPQSKLYQSSSGATGYYNRPASQYGAPTAQYYGPTYQQKQQIPILRLDSNNNGDGTYSYAFETANGIVGQEQGDARGDGTRAAGGFAYTSPNGQPIQVQYTADENGFLPQGSHLPVGLTGPILKSIQQNLAEERRGVVDDGQYKAGQSYEQRQQQYSTTQTYAAPQKYVTPQKYATPQKYGTPTRYNAPQKFNTAQQYRVPQTPQNKYSSGYSRRPQTGYKN